MLKYFNKILNVKNNVYCYFNCLKCFDIFHGSRHCVYFNNTTNFWTFACLLSLVGNCLYSNYSDMHRMVQKKCTKFVASEFCS